MANESSRKKRPHCVVFQIFWKKMSKVALLDLGKYQNEQSHEVSWVWREKCRHGEQILGSMGHNGPCQWNRVNFINLCQISKFWKIILSPHKPIYYTLYIRKFCQETMLRKEKKLMSDRSSISCKEKRMTTQHITNLDVFIIFLKMHSCSLSE